MAEFPKVWRHALLGAHRDLRRMVRAEGGGVMDGGGCTNFRAWP